MGVRGLLLCLLGIVLLYTVAGHGDGQDYSGYGGYGSSPSNRGYGLGRRSYGYGRWWCTCKTWCRFGEWRVRNTCAIPFYPYWMKTCCKWLPWWKTTSSSYGGGYGTPRNGPYSSTMPTYGSGPDRESSGIAGYGSPGGDKGI